MTKYHIFMKQSEEQWVLIEECEDDLVLADRLLQLRKDGKEYRAEKRDGFFATILDE
jgi:hypothetical protein